ncbi:ribosome maturation factor RimP [Clostridium swellfunianum]|uniref:ribosome maturation factor RimP n=1 Tax=Clostridium swellfunianum TaxID=1367462 RepID=UPI00203067E5|nr:ribosome maturation factor RimP [Clostridium swellfunianum]MCM0648587.1 ribosome maturation factor RimP [Clostridium swellfunianum]
MIDNFAIEKLFKLVEPIVTEKGFEFYHLEYVKEFGENYLRVYIDSPKGINLDDCESVSRPISDMLDTEDPISEAYYLEVSSPGIDRALYTDKHLSKYTDSQVLVKLDKLFEGKKQYEGILSDYSSEEITLKINEQDFIIPRDKIKIIRLNGEM